MSFPFSQYSPAKEEKKIVVHRKKRKRKKKERLWRLRLHLSTELVGALRLIYHY